MGSLIPGRAFGDFSFKVPAKACVKGVDIVTAKPDVRSMPIVMNDGKHRMSFAIFASDGLWDRLSDEQASAIVFEALVEEHDLLGPQDRLQVAQSAAVRLVETAVNVLGSGDNTSAVVVLL